MRKASWFFFFILAVSCLDEPDCYQLNSNIIGITFRVMGSTKPDTLLIKGVHLNGTDSIFSDTTLATSMALPMNITTSETDITLDQFNDIFNHIRVAYVTQTQFVSEDCGSRYVVAGLQVLEHDFDSARVVNATGGRQAQNNIEVYRCPDPNILTVSFRELYVTSSGQRTSKNVGVSITGITADFTGQVFWENSRTATVYLPVSTEADQSTFSFVFPGGATYSLPVTYTRTTDVRYNPCGEQTFITSLAVGEHTFDSVSRYRDANGKFRTTLTDPPETNLNVYRCPQTNLLQMLFKTPVNATTNRTDTVVLKSVKANYTPTIFYTNVAVSKLVLPVDSTQAATDFYLEYEDRVDTLHVSFDARTRKTLFKACGTPNLFSQLKASGDVVGASVEVLETDSLQYPPVSNLEIIK